MERKIILASTSPRRKQLLEQVGLNFEVVESPYEEDMTIDKDPYRLASTLALGKASAVAESYNDAIIIAADTFVIFAGKFLGKPKSKEEARAMLKTIDDKKVQVVSGYAIMDTKNNECINSYGEGSVKMAKMDEKDIDWYINTEEPLDKAGAFGVQGKGSVFIESVEGDWYSIIAMPIRQVYRHVERMMKN